MKIKRRKLNIRPPIVYALGKYYHCIKYDKFIPIVKCINRREKNKYCEKCNQFTDTIKKIAKDQRMGKEAPKLRKIKRRKSR